MTDRVLVDHVVGGKYRISELIGQGGMGTVFEGVHTGTGSRVAIKVIVSKDIKEEVSIRFQREARAAATIDSPHIVRVFDMGIDDATGSPYMVMERLSGEDASQLTRRIGPLAPEAALQIALQAALGLAKAHAKGIVHRDIKPANLFLHDGGDHGEAVVKILDFGIAKVLMDSMQRAEEGGLTRTGSMLGSPHYMSPEQAQGLRTIDHRADIWSLGVVLYKLFTGQTPHAHLQTLGQVILAICSQAPRPVQDLAPWIPAEAAAIVHRALQGDPARRFQSAAEMADAIRPLVAHLPPLRRGDLQPLTSEQRMHVAASVYARSDVPTNGTQAGVTTHATQGRSTSPTRGIVYALATLGVLGAVGLAGIGASLMARKNAHASPPVAATAPATAPAPPPPAASSPPPPAASASAAEPMRVTVAIQPAGASVEVDGAKRPVVGGAVVVEGPLGSVHRLHAVANGGEATQSVAITEGGAIPPKVVVGAPSSTAPSSPPRGGKSVVGAGKPAATATGTGVNVQRTFE